MAKITLDWYSELGSQSISATCIYQAPVVEKVDSGIHRIKIYPVDNSIGRAFHRYGGHIEFIRFKEYYRLRRGHSLSIYARFSGKKRTSLYISREKGDQ